MKYLIAGSGGMLGSDIMLALAGRDVTGLTRGELDITDESAVRAAVAGHDVVINAAAFTRVDDAESQEQNAHLINAVGAGNLASAAAESGAKLVQFSTDYVFDGRATKPYPENAQLAPVSAYGRTKADGERLVQANNPGNSYIIRTAWLYGAHGPNFAKTMRSLAAKHPELSVVDDQVGQPTWTVDLARQVVVMLDVDAPAGIYHGTNSGEASWFEFARAVFAVSGLDPDRIRPADSSAFVRPAPRPPYSVLGHAAWSAVGLPAMRPWNEALVEAAQAGAITP